MNLKDIYKKIHIDVYRILKIYFIRYNRMLKVNIVHFLWTDIKIFIYK